LRRAAFTRIGLRPDSNGNVRLFVAIVPPARALAELADAVGPLRQARPELRWTTQADWHLTLAFLGEVADRVLPDLAVRLERAAARHPTRRLAISGGGAFPGPRRASVLWAGIESDVDLGPLAASVAAGARRAGAPPPDEGRRYRAHVTLARCRSQADVVELTSALSGFAGSPWTADSVRLIRSNPGREPRYEDLGSWPLKHSGG
jgi:RNA 2',3'-cyclic 3'-phosphodiesterase